jgi:hypothetical protein
MRVWMSFEHTQICPHGINTWSAQGSRQMTHWGASIRRPSGSLAAVDVTEADPDAEELLTLAAALLTGLFLDSVRTATGTVAVVVGMRNTVLLALAGFEDGTDWIDILGAGILVGTGIAALGAPGGGPYNDLDVDKDDDDDDDEDDDEDDAAELEDAELAPLRPSFVRSLYSMA